MYPMLVVFPEILAGGCAGLRSLVTTPDQDETLTPVTHRSPGAGLMAAPDRVH